MSSTWTTWLLAGALAASFAWHFNGGHLRCGSAAPEEGAPCCAPELILDELSLTAEQRRELEAWRVTTCEQSSCADGAAETSLAKLQEALRDPGVSEDRLRELAGEVNEARAKSLESCVDAIVAVRRVLSPEQLRLLLDSCCPTSKGSERASE